MSSQSKVTVWVGRTGQYWVQAHDARAVKLLAKAARHGLPLTIVAPWAGRGGSIKHDAQLKLNRGLGGESARGDGK